MGFVIAIVGFLYIFMRRKAKLSHWKSAIYAASLLPVLGLVSRMLTLRYPEGLIENVITLPWPLG